MGGVISVAAEAEAARAGTEATPRAAAATRAAAAAAAEEAAPPPPPPPPPKTAILSSPSIHRPKHYRTMSIAGFTVNYERNVWRANPYAPRSHSLPISAWRLASYHRPPAAHFQGSTPPLRKSVAGSWRCWQPNSNAPHVLPPSRRRSVAGKSSDEHGQGRRD